MTVSGIGVSLYAKRLERDRGAGDYPFGMSRDLLGGERSGRPPVGDTLERGADLAEGEEGDGGAAVRRRRVARSPASDRLRYHLRRDVPRWRLLTFYVAKGSNE